MSYYVQYNLFYYSTICHVCKETNQNLKRCAACKAVAYCSKNHQKQDWTLHKDLCRAIVKSNNSFKHTDINSFDNFKQYNVSRSLLWISKLSRELFSFECQMWMFPRVCAVCFSKNVIIDCPGCVNVSYCSEMHKNIHEERHSNFCAALKLGMDLDLYYFQDKFRPTDISVCEFKSEVTVLPNNLRELMGIYDKDVVPKESDSDKLMQFIIKSNFVAPVATILYGMEKSGMVINRFFNGPKLTVHIVGANITEMSWLWKITTELPFHWIKNLKRLDFHLIGPELHHKGITEKFAEQLCESCKARQPVTKIFFHWKLYHKIASYLDKPDTVVAFNSGLHELGENSWHESINCLTMYCDVPLLLTAYTEKEISLDVNTVRTRSDRNVEVVLEPQVNPFAKMTPLRDWETEIGSVFYINGYIAILKAK